MSLSRMASMSERETREIRAANASGKTPVVFIHGLWLLPSSWANALDDNEAKELYDTFHVAGSGISLAQMGNANLNPWTQAKVNTKNPDRGPLLIIDGEKDHTVPWAIANAAYKRQRRNVAVTEIVKIPNRGHALTIDHGWREVAQTALDFLKRFVPAKPD